MFTLNDLDDLLDLPSDNAHLRNQRKVLGKDAKVAEDSITHFCQNLHGKSDFPDHHDLENLLRAKEAVETLVKLMVKDFEKHRGKLAAKHFGFGQ